MVNEPKLMIYADRQLTQMLQSLDFGEVDVDESKTQVIYAINYGDRALSKIKITSKSSDVTILACPNMIDSGIIAEIKLSWTPRSGLNLLDNIEITGKFSRV